MSGSEPLVDVVIVAYCSAETLAASVGSVASDPAVADVIVVDNASPDDSAAVAEAAGARVVATGANLGFGGGCNRGAAAGRSPYVLFLNPDAAAQPGTVAGLAAHLAGSPRAGAVASELRFADGGRQPSRRRFPRWWLAPAEPGLSAELDERWYRRRARGPRVDWVTGACFRGDRSVCPAG